VDLETNISGTSSIPRRSAETVVVRSSPLAFPIVAAVPASIIEVDIFDSAECALLIEPTPDKIIRGSRYVLNFIFNFP